MLKAEDFKAVHNGLCHIRGVLQHLEEVLHPTQVQRLARGVEEIVRGLQDAYRQETDSFKTKSTHYETVQSKLGARAVWSIYEVQDLSLPHPYPEARAVVYKDHWGDRPVQALIEGTTYADLYKAADLAIKRSGDQHHVFIEDLKPSKEDPTKLVLHTGS
jgi:hypothetical protein